MIMNVDTLIHPGWIFTAEPTSAHPFGETLNGYSVAINNGEIIAVAARAEIEAQYQSSNTIQRPSAALLPGWVNAHTHIAMNLLRGYGDDLPLMTWLQDKIWPAEGQHVSHGFVKDGSRLAIAEMLKGGTTCFNDMYMFPDAVAEAAIELGIRAVVGQIIIDFPTAWAVDADEYFAKGAALQQQTQAQPLISTVMAPHAPYTVNDGNLTRAKRQAEELDIRLHIHLHETAQEVADSLEQHGVKPLQRLYELGLLNERTLAVHMTQLDDSDIALCAQQGVNIIHCPESNLKLASGMARIADCLQANINVALGTDGAASNNDLSMLGELRTAALLAKGVSGNASALPAAAALQMATLNGAKALGLDDITGSIKVGKAADLQCINLNSLNSQPSFDIASTIAYAVNDRQVSDVWVNGVNKLRDGQLVDIDEAKLLNTAKLWQAKISAC